MIHIFFTNERWPWQHHWCVWHFPLQFLRMIAVRNVSPLSLHQIISVCVCVSCIYHRCLCIWKGNYIVRCIFIVYCISLPSSLWRDNIPYFTTQRHQLTSTCGAAADSIRWCCAAANRQQLLAAPSYTLNSRTELAGRRSLTSTNWMEKTNIWYLQMCRW